MSWLYDFGASRVPFHDFSWKRSEMAEWDRRWHALSPAARQHFLKDFRSVKSGGQKPRDLMKRVPEPAREELIFHNFVEARVEPRGTELHITEAAKPFATRVRLLLKCHLLQGAEHLTNFTSRAFDHYGFYTTLGKVVQKALNVDTHQLPLDMVETFVAGPRWAGWVANYLNSPLDRPVLDAVRQAGGKFSLARLGELLPDRGVEVVRKEVDALVNHLALVEDVDEQTGEILVGFMPEALRGRPGAASRGLVPLAPTEASPEGGELVPDIRAVLLELSCGPAQLKQSGSLYARDEERLVSCISEVPAWVPRATETAERVRDAIDWADDLGLVSNARRGGKSLLQVSKRGAEWLATPHSQQYAPVYRDLAGLPKGREWGEFGDHDFLGTSVAVMPYTPAQPGKVAKRPPSAHDVVRKADPMELRRAVLAALSTLQVGTFYKFSSVMDHLTAPERNPLLLGRPIGQVLIVSDHYNVLLPLEEVVEAAARRVLTEFIDNRLYPLGCVRWGRAGNELVIATTLYLPLYFDPTKPFPEGGAAEKSRTIVQPDFSVLVIGLSPAPAAELAAFASRDRSSNTPGAITFRLTREDVMRGLHAGLSGDEMVARLEKHAATGVPANVRTQLLTWAGQGRVVNSGPMMVFRCPDEETAGRVLSAVGKKAERLGPTSVGLVGKVNSALRQKLLAQGVMLREAGGEDD